MSLLLLFWKSISDSRLLFSLCSATIQFIFTFTVPISVDWKESSERSVFVNDLPVIPTKRFASSFLMSTTKEWMNWNGINIVFVKYIICYIYFSRYTIYTHAEGLAILGIRLCWQENALFKYMHIYSSSLFTSYIKCNILLNLFLKTFLLTFLLSLSQSILIICYIMLYNIFISSLNKQCHE